MTEVRLTSPSSHPFAHNSTLTSTSLNWSFLRVGRDKEGREYILKEEKEWTKALQILASIPYKTLESILYKNEQWINFSSIFFPQTLRPYKLLSEILGKTLWWKQICLGWFENRLCHKQSISRLDFCTLKLFASKLTSLCWKSTLLLFLSCWPYSHLRAKIKHV